MSTINNTKFIYKGLIIKSLFISFLSVIFLAIYAQAQQCQTRLFDFKTIEAVSIEESLEQLASLCSFTIVFKDSIAKEKVKQTQRIININQAPLRDIFDILIKENNLYYEFNNKLLKISGIQTRTFNLSYITSIREGQSITKASVDARAKQSDFSITENNLEDNMIKSSEKFDFWHTIEEELFALLNNGSEEYQAPKPIINANAGLITISATSEQLKRAALYLKNLEYRLKKQVMIDVSIIAVNLDKSHSNGINWQNFSLSFGSQNADLSNSSIRFENSNNGNFFVKNLGFQAELNFASILNFLSQSGQTKVLSNPKLMALNNQQAIISVGDTINYQVRESSKSTESGTTVSEIYNNYSIFVGILLNILPEISDENKIMLRINPSLSSFKYPQDNRRQDTPRTIAPDTIQKKLSTVVQMENNETLILGGLISHEKADEESSVNFLSSIPLLGALFRGSEHSEVVNEIVFIITPTIVMADTSMPSLKDLGFKHYE